MPFKLQQLGAEQLESKSICSSFVEHLSRAKFQGGSVTCMASASHRVLWKRGEGPTPRGNICHKLREAAEDSELGKCRDILMGRQMPWRKVPKGSPGKHKARGKHSGSSGEKSGRWPWPHFQGCMCNSLLPVNCIQPLEAADGTFCLPFVLPLV